MNAPETTRQQGRPASTSREAVVAHATDLVRSHGAGGLTIRAVAAATGVSPMTVYTYVADREDLLDAVARAYLEATPRPATTGDWRSDLRRLARDDWARARQQPHLARLVIDRGGRGIMPPGLPDFVFDGLLEAGFTRKQAELAVGTLGTFILGAFSRLTLPRADRIDAEFDAALELILDGISSLPDRRPLS